MTGISLPPKRALFVCVCILASCTEIMPRRQPMAEITLSPKRVLFVCIENSNRSQMAEAFARLHGGEQVEAYSAGSRPSGRINPKAIESMREVGYDLSQHQSKSL